MKDAANKAELDRIRNERARFMEAAKRKALSNKKHEEDKNNKKQKLDACKKQIALYSEEVIR
jgi:hypothetical protein